MATSSNGGGFTVVMTHATDASGVDIIDPIERRRCTLRTSKPVSPENGNPNQFQFPVETVVKIDTPDVSAPFTGHAYVRDHQGGLVAEAKNGYADSFPAGNYTIELTGLIKVYLHFESAFSIENGFGGLYLEFPGTPNVSIGSRSAHRRPPTTVTTTSDPSDLVEAISTFGSALTSVSAERTFPTWRGHPPALEIGETLDIPDGLAPPIDDIVIEVPPTFEHLFPVAPLAYYLGVGLEAGHVPRIVGDGIDHLLTHPNGFDRAVHETLQRLFLLECATRTEGMYPVNLLERKRIEERIELPFEELYEAPVADRLETFLDVPFRLIEDIIPDWRLAAHVAPEPSSIPMLPHLTNDLALITLANGKEIPATSQPGQTAGVLTRGSSTTTRGTTESETTFVKPNGGPAAIETAWVSDGLPVNSTKAVLEAYENRLGRQPQDNQIEIAVVCNSADMAEELDVVNDVYGNHEEMPFDVVVHEGLTTSELEMLIQRDFNFFHYIGHIDDEGFRCADGRLDMTGVEDIGPEAFFLNACQSYEQGLSLIHGGAIGGIVTLNDVVNHGAIRIGRTVARLLNTGFPLRAALDIASTESVVGSQYIVVGDGTLSIVQPQSGTPHLYEAETSGSETSLTFNGFGAPPGMGCMYLPYIQDCEFQNLAEGTSETFQLSEHELQSLFSLDNVPVELNGELRWSFELLD